MRIESISLKNFKRQDTVQRLTGKDIFVGPNGTGKSARILALGTALLGYVPGAPGRRPQDTFQVATSDRMEVGLATGQFGFSRTFERKGKTKKDGTYEVTIAQSISVSPSRGESTLTQKEARIAQELGNFPVMLDFGQFLAKSDSERRAFFYRLADIDADAWSRDAIEARLTRTLVSESLREANPDAYAARVEMIAQAMREWRPGLDAEAGVQAMLEWTKARQKHWNAESSKATGAVQKLAELKNQLEETDRGVADNRQAIEQLQEEINRVTADIARQQEKKRQAEQRAARLSELAAQIDSLESQQPDTDVSAIDRAIEELKSQIVRMDDIRPRVQEIGREVTALTADAEVAQGKINAVNKSVASSEARIQGLEQSVSQADRGGVCVIAPNIACPKDFSAYVKWADEALAANRADLAIAKQGLDTLVGDREAMRRSIQNLQNEREGLYARQMEQRTVNADLEERIKKLETKRSGVLNSEQRRRDRLEDLNRELTRVQSEPAGEIATIDLLEKHVEGLKANVQALKEKVQEQEKARTTISNMKASMIDSKTAENSHAAAKHLAEALGPKGLQGEMLGGSLDPIRDSVTANLCAMGVEHPFFFRMNSDRGQEVFRFGWVDNRQREVDFDALSTGQQVIVLAALLIAILDRADPPCKVLAIDNCENLDRQNFQRVVAGLEALSDRLDNIILAGVLDIEELPGWAVHRLGEEGGEASELAS